MPKAVEGSVIQMGITGKYVNPLDLKTEDVDVRDIAHHLGNQCRYSGAPSKHYSVAQHAVLCALEAERRGYSPDVVYTILHHDDAEAFLQDVARPLKEDPYFGKAYRGAEQRAERVIAEALSFIYPFPDVVKELDMILLATERRDIMPRDGLQWKILEGIVPLEKEVVPWGCGVGSNRFNVMHQRLVREGVAA